MFLDRRHSFATALLLAIILSPAAAAQAAGEIGSISPSTISIRASVAPRMRLTGLDGVRVPSGFADSSAPLIVPVCIAGNTNTRMYSVTVLGRAIPVTVSWDEKGDRRKARRLVRGSASPAFKAGTGSCAATGDRSTAILSMEALPDAEDSPGTSLPDRTLTFLIAPE